MTMTPGRAAAAEDAAALLRTFEQRATFIAYFQPAPTTVSRADQSSTSAGAAFVSSLRPLVLAARTALVATPAALESAPSRATTVRQRRDWISRYLATSGRTCRVRLDAPGVVDDHGFWWWLAGSAAGTLLLLQDAAVRPTLEGALTEPDIIPLTRLERNGYGITRSVMRRAGALASASGLVVSPYARKAGGKVEVNMFGAPGPLLQAYWYAMGWGHAPTTERARRPELPEVFATVMAAGAQAALRLLANETGDRARLLDDAIARARAQPDATTVVRLFGFAELVAARGGHPSAHLSGELRTASRKGRAFTTSAVTAAIDAIRWLEALPPERWSPAGERTADGVLRDLVVNLHARLRAALTTAIPAARD